MRLVRHLSFSNVIAMLALFIALGGAAYAGTKINGSSIKNGSIGGGKLKSETITADKIKKGTITGAQIQNGSIDASQINLTTLGTVPSAQTAQTASKAETATKADSATSAATAANAENAKHAETADMATKAEIASSATEADTAAAADHATTAGDAEKLGGKTRGEIAAELEVTCPNETEFYGGMCWDEATRQAKFWLGAVVECGEKGGRLPSIEELIAFVLQEGTQVSGQTWSADIDQLEPGNKELVFTTDETGRSTADGSLFGGLLGYRCVFPRSN